MWVLVETGAFAFVHSRVRIGPVSGAVVGAWTPSGVGWVSRLTEPLLPGGPLGVGAGQSAGRQSVSLFSHPRCHKGSRACQTKGPRGHC